MARIEDIEEYRQMLLHAIDVMNPTSECQLDVNTGTIEVNGNSVYPKELVDYKAMEELIDKKDFYDSLGSDARIIVDFICLTDIELLQKLCGSKVRKKVTAKRVAQLFRKKWGRKRTREAMVEIKKMLAM